MNERKVYRTLLLAAAVWNMVATGSILVAADLFGALDWLGMEPVRYWIFFDNWLAAAFVYGVGYVWAARDPHRNRDIVRLGALGKLVFVIIASARFVQSRVAPATHPWVHPILLLGLAGDLVCVGLFFLFLRWEQRARTTVGPQVAS